MYTHIKQPVAQLTCKRLEPCMMNDKDDLSTIPQSGPHEDATAPATIKVPVVQAPTPAAAPPTNPYVSVDDLLALQIATDPQISPDGSLIAFVVQKCNVEANT